MTLEAGKVLEIIRDNLVNIIISDAIQDLAFMLDQLTGLFQEFK